MEDVNAPAAAVELLPAFVTGRLEKAAEASRMGFLFDRVALELSEPQALEPAEVVEAKVRDAFSRLRRPVIVEDSGLEIHAWKGFPGALVKWLETTAGVEGIVRMLDAFPQRAATAICAVAYFDGARLTAARGSAQGSIAASPRGRGGFGWDAIFVPQGSDRTFAEMSEEDKDRFSHRRKAWEALAGQLAGSLKREPHSGPN